MNNMFSIIEIGSNNTKIHIYKEEKLIYEKTITIEFKKNYQIKKQINEEDLNKLYEVIKNALTYTNNVNIYGCSIFRNISNEELDEINKKIYEKFKLKIQVVSQEDEANYTALGCYKNIEYNENICIFIGGGGSTELIFVKNKEVIAKKYYDFGVVDITNKFESLKNDIPTCSFSEVYDYVDDLIGKIDIKADILILAGGDHLYWYNNARYNLMENTLYKNEKQKYMLTIEMSDNYDKNALVTSLDKIRANSDNPKWFDGSRAMKVLTNLISHKIESKYIVPTKINMEDLISIGSMGLIKGIQTFKMEKNIKLATYASRCIENEILMYLRKTQKSRQEYSLDEVLSIDSEGNEMILSDIIGSSEPLALTKLSEEEDIRNLYYALDRLSKREREIIIMRYGLFGVEPLTQKEVADKMGISQSYISRLEKRIIEKMRQDIEQLVKIA